MGWWRRHHWDCKIRHVQSFTWGRNLEEYRHPKTTDCGATSAIQSMTSIMGCTSSTKKNIEPKKLTIPTGSPNWRSLPTMVHMSMWWGSPSLQKLVSLMRFRRAVRCFTGAWTIVLLECGSLIRPQIAEVGTSPKAQKVVRQRITSKRVLSLTQAPMAIWKQQLPLSARWSLGSTVAAQVKSLIFRMRWANSC